MKKGISFMGVIGAIAFMIVLAFIPMRAQAATFKTYNDGSVVLLKRQGKIYYTYTLEEDSVVEINYAYNEYKSSSMYIYRTKEMTDDPMWEIWSVKEKDKLYYVLRKGTYYIDMYDDLAMTKVKLTSTPVAAYDKGNYCAAEAQPLSANKWAKFAISKDYEYTHWYKIKTTKTAKVTIDVPHGAMFYTLINAKNKKEYPLVVNYEDQQLVTKNRIPAGNYYIAVHWIGVLYNAYATDNSLGCYYQFRWY